VERDYLQAETVVAGAPGSAWLAREVREHPPATGDITADVLVVGAGIVGALTAYELISRGLSVALIERRRIAGATTGHSTAKITVVHDTSWSARLGRRGLHPGLAEWASLNAATPVAIGELVRSRSIDCGFRRLDAHLVAASPAAEAAVVRELRTLERLGLEVDDLGSMPEAPLGGTRCIRVADQAQFDPAAFVSGLIDSLPAQKLTVVESTPVRKLVREGSCWVARLDTGTARAGHVVMTALAPVRDPALLFARLYPYAAYVFEFLPRVPMPDGFWIQAGDEGLTLRPTAGPEGAWIAAGQHVRQASRPDERVVYADLLGQVRSRYPDCEPVRHWSTEDLWTPDWLPYVGAVGPRRGLYMVAGFGGWGMSASLPAARLVADAVAGSPNSGLLRFLSPNRFPGLRTLPEVTRESIIVGRRLLLPSAQQRRAVAAPGVTAVTPGSTPPRCTHLRCRLKVDPAEGTINCPCHGSRFTGTGEALYGPAKRDLPGTTPGAGGRTRAEA
jgi:glycine/D-amino acid oxidase-like deaminating enzyme